MIVLGFHGGVTLGQHEPGVALAIDGKIVVACEEERYLRFKSGYGHLPYYSVLACLKHANVRWEDIDLVVSSGITYSDHQDRLRDYLRHNFGSCPEIVLIHHQRAHLAAAFYGSGLEESLVLSLDATGDRSCGMLAKASRDSGIEILEEIPTKNSLGYFYTLMTYYLGFSDGDEYKVMGLAPYGEPTVDLDKILHPIDGGWQFDWSFVRAEPVVRSPFEPLYDNARIEKALGQPPRRPGDEVTPYYRDVARSTQATLEACLLSLARGLKSKAPEISNLCYAGGIALNCAANQKLLQSGLFDNIYVSPVSSDRGLAIGCAYQGAIQSGDNPWPMWNAYLGSGYSQSVMREELESNGVSYQEVEDPAEAAAELLGQRKIIGWYQGRSEAGARALGNRSILASAEDADMRDQVNARIKYREEFRPFAPSALFEQAENYFKTDGRDFPYMCFTVDALDDKAGGMEAVVHVDGTVRLQTVRSSENELYYDLIKKYYDASGTPVILNTSYNLKGQPIVETPRDALMTFFGCGLDTLIMGNFVITKPAHD